MEQAEYILDLNDLSKGLPGITSVRGADLAQAGAVCLEEHGHAHGTTLSVRGGCEATFAAKWPPVDEQVRRCWNDTQEATEQGASAVALLLIVQLTEYTVVERSKKGTGFDYWLGLPDDENDLPFQNRARLEVSGILSGTSSVIASRVKQKLNQVSVTDGTWPAFVVVVEFSSPESRIEKK